MKRLYFHIIVLSMLAYASCNAMQGPARPHSDLIIDLIQNDNVMMLYDLVDSNQISITEFLRSTPRNPNTLLHIAVLNNARQILAWFETLVDLHRITNQDGESVADWMQESQNDEALDDNLAVNEPVAADNNDADIDNNDEELAAAIRVSFSYPQPVANRAEQPAAAALRNNLRPLALAETVIPADDKCMICKDEAKEIAAENLQITACCKQLLCKPCFNHLSPNNPGGDNCPNCRRSKAEGFQGVKASSK